MTPSPTEEIRAIRRNHSAQLNDDIRLIAEDARRRQRESGRRYITLPRRLPQFPRIAAKADTPRG